MGASVCEDIVNGMRLRKPPGLKTNEMFLILGIGITELSFQLL